MRHTLAVLLALTITLAACAPVTPAAPTATVAPSATSAPTTTSAPTATPEISEDELVSGFELKATSGYEDRTFSKEDRDGVTYLVDQYNNVPKLVRNGDGSWRELDYTNPADAEIMYGPITPKDMKYIDKNMLDFQGIFQAYSMNLVYTGDFTWETRQYEGSDIQYGYLICTARDGAGNLHVVKYGVGADILPNGDTYSYGYITIEKSGNQSSMDASSVKDFIVHLAPESTLSTDISTPRKYPIGKFEYPYDPYWMTNEMFNSSTARLTNAEWDKLSQAEWPSDRVVELYGTNNPIAVYIQ